MRLKLLALCAAVLGTLGVTASTRPSYVKRATDAQQHARPGNDHRIATWVVLDEAYSDAGGNPIIVRGVGAARPDLILVTPNTTPAQLASAALQLSRIRSEKGDVGVAPAKYRVMSAPTHAKTTAEDRVAARVLGRLRSAEYRDIPVAGRARVVEIYLPDATLRAAIQKAGRTKFSNQP